MSNKNCTGKAYVEDRTKNITNKTTLAIPPDSVICLVWSGGTSNTHALVFGFYPYLNRANGLFKLGIPWESGKATEGIKNSMSPV